MSEAAVMLRTYPADITMDRDLLARCIDACLDCSQACTACADSCLSEKEIDMLRKCIRTNLDCADVCDATGRILSRHTGYDANITRSLVTACMWACKSCGDECAKHSHMRHCEVCAEACRKCEQACGEVLNAIGS